MNFARRVIVFVWVIPAVVGCQKVTLIIPELPENTPPGSPVYITGNFNYWDPGDSYFVLQPLENGGHYITLPTGDGRIEFKFTRGDWTTVEAGICGEDLPNRRFRYGTADTLSIQLSSWKDLGPVNCPEVTFSIIQLPEQTPSGDSIYIAGNFNSWNPREEDYRLKPNSSGTYCITLHNTEDIIEYKFTRGDWSRVEADELGAELPTRTFRFGRTDSIEVSIPNWMDMIPDNKPSVTFIVEELPASTPDDAELYMVGNFNNWYPRDRNYLMTRAGGSFTLTLPLLENKMEYQFTRGGWSKMEVFADGSSRPNREFLYQGQNIVFIKIAAWKDLLGR